MEKRTCERERFLRDAAVGFFSTDLDVVESEVLTGVLYTGYDLSRSYG